MFVAAVAVLPVITTIPEFHASMFQVITAVPEFRWSGFLPHDRRSPALQFKRQWPGHLHATTVMGATTTAE